MQQSTLYVGAFVMFSRLLVPFYSIHRVTSKLKSRAVSISLESMCYRRFKKKENSALTFPCFCPRLKPPNDNCCFESNVGSEMRHPPACGGRADGRCVFFIIIVIISFCLFVCFRLFSFLFRSILYINIFQGVWCIMTKA